MNLHPEAGTLTVICMDEIKIAAVTAIPERYDRAVEISRELKGASIIVDPPGLWKGGNRNQLRTWEALRADGVKGWALAVEDDAILHPDFWNRANALLVDAPSPVVSFYSMGWKNDPNHPEGWRMIPGGQYLGAVCLAWRLEFLTEYLRQSYRLMRESQALWGSGGNYYDGIQKLFYAEQKVKVAVAIPNLADHDLSVPSWQGHQRTFGGHERRSYTFNADI